METMRLKWKAAVSAAGTVAAVTGMLLLAACVSGNNSAGSESDAAMQPVKESATSPVADKKQDPVTITIAMRTGYLTEEEFKRFVSDPVKKKFPYITAEQVIMDGQHLLPDRVAAGDTPDMSLLTNVDLGQLVYLKLDYPLDDMMKANKISASDFKPETIEAVKLSSGTDKLIGLPLKMQFSALYYNKDIFDKFGAAYPKDGMTWEDAREVAKKVTRVDSGVQYRGLEPMLVYRVASQLALPVADPKTFKATLDTDGWKRVFTLLKSIYDIPGNNKMTFNATAVTEFTKTRTLAMLTGPNYFYAGNLDKMPDFNWDMATHPVFAEAPGTSTKVDAHTLSIMSTSKHKEDAFKIIATTLSDEVQSDMAKQADISPLKDPKYSKLFAQDVPFLKGKNVQAAVALKPAKAIDITPYYDLATKQLRDAMNKVIKGTDVNSALREANEKTDQAIAAAREGTN
jgi:multiple sugar transport system substrate-binding protein